LLYLLPTLFDFHILLGNFPRIMVRL